MLQVLNVTKRYRHKTVLNGVSLALEGGQCLGVAGHNGSGKSTLLSIVAQTLPPDAGAIRCDGHDVLGNRRFLRAMVGYVPQQNALLDDLTVRQTLHFWQKAYSLPATDPLAPGTPGALMGLGEIAKKRVGALSGGMQKRLSIALALLHSPRYLLMDEVLPALDRHYRAALTAWLAAYKQNGAALLYCSHEVDELRQFCDSVLVLREGRTVFYDTVDKFPTDTTLLDEWMNPANHEPPRK